MASENQTHAKRNARGCCDALGAKTQAPKRPLIIACMTISQPIPRRPTSRARIVMAEGGLATVTEVSSPTSADWLCRGDFPGACVRHVEDQDVNNQTTDPQAVALYEVAAKMFNLV